MSLRLLVVRHGETEYSRGRRFAGSRDVPLTAAGRRQAEAVAQALAGVAATAVHSSPQARALATAEIVAAPHGLTVTVEPDFREMAFGGWEGMSRDEVATRFPDGYRLWRESPERAVPPGGETLDAVARRVARALAALRGRHPEGTVILVTHAVVVRLLVLGALGLGPERLWSVDATPAGISELEYRDDWVTVHRINTLTHLAAEAAAP